MRKCIRGFLCGILFLIVGGVMFLFLYKPFGGVIAAAEQEQYGRAVNYNNGKFEQPSSGVALMTGNKSTFDGTGKKPKDEIPVHRLTEIPEASETELNIVWFGHSSSLLQLGGINILIDPVLSDYASPVQGVGPRRFSDFPIDACNMPQIDILVLSHDHYDHMDYGSIRTLMGKVSEYCVPMGVETHLIRWGVPREKIHVMAWWDSLEVAGVKITSTPGQHFTGRLPWNSNKTLWCGYAFQTEGKTVYYTGDTGYGEHFKAVHNQIGDVDLLLLECGQYDQAWSQVHMFPEQGIRVAEDVNAAWTIPVHFGTFCICNHPWDDSIRKITQYAEGEGRNLATPLIGEIVSYDRIADYQQKWWMDIE